MSFSIGLHHEGQQWNQSEIAFRTFIYSGILHVKLGGLSCFVLQIAKLAWAFSWKACMRFQSKASVYSCWWANNLITENTDVSLLINIQAVNTAIDDTIFLINRGKIGICILCSLITFSTRPDSLNFHALLLFIFCVTSAPRQAFSPYKITG